MRLINSLLLISSYCIFGLLLAVQAHSAPAIEWQPEQLNIRQTAGSTVNQTLAVTFSDNAHTLTTRLTPDFDAWLSVLPVILDDVQAGQSVQITLSGIVPADEPLGIQRGVLQIRSGVDQNNLAKPLPVAITVIEGTDGGLPPDPGEEGKQTLMGIDSDGDGLRDDIQRYIYLTYPDQPNVQGALRQHALSLQKTLDPEREAGAGRQLAKEIGSSMDCVAYFVDDGFYKTVQLLKAEVVNTYKRTKQYLAYDKELSGGIFPGSRLPLRERYKHCDFELEPH